MSQCINCNKISPLISSAIGVCLDCIRSDFGVLREHFEKIHIRSRKAFGLPPIPPVAEEGLKCNLCLNKCVIPDGGIGFCGVRRNEGGKLVGGLAEWGNLEWYHDKLPTNCVSDWVCAGGTGCGYPRFSHRRGAEYGYKNLAVFFNSCNFNCLYCQNWHYRVKSIKKSMRTAEEMVNDVDKQTSCICYFGGDPSTQLPFSIQASRLAIQKKGRDISRICWETNGGMDASFLEEMANLALSSGGCIKFDLKAWSEKLNFVLCGVSNQQTLSNFEFLAKLFDQRPDPPFLIASTLLVPGYVDEEEVAAIARFIASLNPNIPYSVLGFHPDFLMSDLPTTSRRHAKASEKVAQDAGLRRVRIGNAHLPGNEY